MVSVSVPIVAVVIGEGGSGGALGVGIADRICVLENAYYSVISPEGCAAILWKDGSKAPDAASVLKLTAPDLVKMGIIDEMIPEPLGGAHRDPAQAAAGIKAVINKYLDELTALDADKLLAMRYAKFRGMGVIVRRGVMERWISVRKRSLNLG